MVGGARDLVLSMEAEERFLPLAMAFAEQGAQCCGLERNEALELTLAVEEVFGHLCRVVMPTGGPLEIRCAGGGYFAEVTFSFRSDALDLRAFNLTASVAVDEEDAELDGMGLFIASRFVDRFRLSREAGEGLRLSLIKEKSYPPADDEGPPELCPTPGYILRSPSIDEVKFIARLARFSYPGRFLSDFFLHPGKLADMVSVGEYQGMAAVGPTGRIGGAILWHWAGPKMVECFGPYIFGSPDDSGMSESLLESCIGVIARTQVVGLINTRPTPELPYHHFERLGTLTIQCEDGTRTPMDAWFRLMREDAGSAVWAHPELQGYLQGEYLRLVLPREIRSTRNAGENLPPHSVLAAEFDRLQGRVVLRPMWPGSDAEENMARHVRLLREDPHLDIFFALDLGQAWQAELAPALLRQRFEPCCVLPYACEGDVVLFEHQGEGS